MANEKILLMAEANKLKIDGYRKMSVDELKAAIANAEGKHTAPKGKAAPQSNGTPAKGKGKPAATAPAAPAKGKGKPAASAKSAPAKSTAQKSTPAKGKAAQGTAKRPTTAGKGKPAAKPAAKATAKPAATKPRSRAAKPVASGRVNIDNRSINWKAESNVGQTGKRKEVLDALRTAKGDKGKVFDALKRRATKFYPAKSKDEAEKMLVWLIGRVAYDFVFKTGQHEPGQRAAYGTSESAQDVRRREQREAARKEALKAARAAKRAGASKPAARGKATAGKGKVTRSR